MTTGFQSYIGCCALRFFPCHCQGIHLSMTFSGTKVETFSDNLFIFHQNTANSWVWVRGVQAISG
jgi:hypothetical protein